jgi:IS5 family transposase
MPGNPYDGHTVDSQLEQVSILTGHTPKVALADRGYRGVEPPAGTRLLISHTRRLFKRLKKLLKRRQVVEPMIGHMKADGLLGKNWLKGADGDALHALLCGAGHNLRMILRHLRVLFGPRRPDLTGHQRGARVGQVNTIPGGSLKSSCSGRTTYPLSRWWIRAS